MSARAFIASLQDRGAALQVEDGRLRVTPAHILTDADRAAWKEHRAAILQVLAAPKIPEPAPPSTCSARTKRVALPSATAAQWDAMNAESYARAELLRRRLVADGVIFKAQRRFGCDRLCVEWQKMAPDDWREVVAHRAELLHMHTTREAVKEFDAGAAHDPAAALREVRATLDKHRTREP